MTACVGQTFASYQFTAKNAPDPAGRRSMPVRLSDVVNVKDWGAKGDNSNDDRPAIQAAIDFAVSRGGGRVFFPPGSYKLPSGALNVGAASAGIRIELIGSGINSTSIVWDGVSNYTISKGSQAFDSLARVEDMSVGGGIKATLDNVAIIQVQTTALGAAQIAFDLSAANMAYVALCSGSGPAGKNANQITPATALGSTIFIALGNCCIADNCRAQGGFDICFALSGYAPAIFGCSAEVHRIGCRVGWGPSGDSTAYGFTVASFQTERCDVSLDLYDCQGGLVTGFTNVTQIGPPTQVPCSNMSWSGPNTATVTTAASHGIPAGTWILQFAGGGGNSNWIPVYSPTITQAWLIATVGGVANQFTYYLPADPGAWSGSVTAMSWDSASLLVTVSMTTSVALPAGTGITLSGMNASWNPAGTGGGTTFNVGVAAGTTTSFTYSLGCKFTGSISGTTLTVSAITLGSLAAGHVVQGTGVAGGTVLVAPIPSSPNWTVNNSQTVASEAMTSGFPSGTQTGTWSNQNFDWCWPASYTLRCRRVFETAILSNNLSGNPAVASIDLDYGGNSTARNNVLWTGVSQLSYGIKLPTTHQLAGWNVTGGCNGRKNPLDGVAGYAGAPTVANVQGQMVFADLPGQAGVTQDGPIEGQEYIITDSPIAASGNFNASVTVGGNTNHVKLRYDGTNWKISG